MILKNQKLVFSAKATIRWDIEHFLAFQWKTDTGEDVECVNCEKDFHNKSKNVRRWGSFTLTLSGP